MPNSAALIDGKAIAQKTHAESRAAVAELKARGFTPGLAVVLVGTDPASRAYVRSKDKMCHDLGMHSVKHELPATTSQADLIALVKSLNADPAIHGILVQSLNVAKLTLGDPDGFVPCTPLGCQRLLIESGIETAGANVVVLGRSMIVGKPMALLLMNKGPGGDATVTVAHSRTRNLAAVCRGADILIAAIGRPECVRADFVKDGAVVIDVGINRVDDPASPKGYRLTGDVAFAEVAPKCRAITPVPGGVGPMTIAMLMANTIASCRRFADLA
jgi:methylenetetrahydrofolate dehydrogenase (NADP+)/methenyltetrahydrofolate cyclohydrolase